ncbi:MAG: DNA-protecting protein DprA [Bacteroidetes bacterium]|nr:MAG: DNA-protecting protein DprA [Bacteroidota bacterium]
MLLYQIALCLIPGIGDVLGKKLVTLCGSAEAVFREPKQILQKVRGIGEVLSHAIGNREIFLRAEKEISFISRFGITPLFFQDPSYPRRLTHCIDGPLLIFYKGTASLNADRVVGIVGTRSATTYGKQICRELVTGLSTHSPLIVSGLAYGIDSCAHRAALDAQLPTIAVLGHGLDRIYPCANSALAEKMLSCVGLLTEFLSGTSPDRENFPKRNRIIAGLVDALVVVEAARKGGALITADIANSYNRDVFAVPGRIGDPWSEGANYLIRTNQAHLLQSAANVEYIMGWREQERKSGGQRKIFLEMTPAEERIVEFLDGVQNAGIDEIMLQTGLSAGSTSAAILNLEFEGIVKALPGKIYQLC